MKNSITFLCCLFISASIHAQSGTVSGRVTDKDLGDAVFAAAVTIEGLPGIGIMTDLDGNYMLTLDPGVYNLVVSLISYETKVQEIHILPNENIVLNVSLGSVTEELGVAEVVTTIRKNSDVAMMLEKKNASIVSDGLSSQTFKKVGDSDLGGAIKRVTGVTVQNGKYVYVRGLGDRYTKTILNGMSIPGLDPDVNSVQLDIFPTAILDNVNVYKTFTPNFEGDFTGGLVNITTKNYPDSLTTQVSFGLGFNPSMHFNNDFILYDGGKFDFFGFDDGSRSIPIDIYTSIPDVVLNDPELETITRGFNSQLSAKNKVALPNGSFSITHGNSSKKDNGKTVGFTTVFNYSNQNTFYSDFQSNDFLKSTSENEYELVKQVNRIGIIGKNNVLWSALTNVSIEDSLNSYSALLLINQNAESTAARRINEDVEQNVATLHENVLTYSQRTLANMMLRGRHTRNNWTINWGNSLSYSRVYDPDFRETRISVTDGDTTLSTGNGAGIDRFWRELNEFNESFKLDIEREYGENIVFKTGALGTFKYRDFTVQAFKHRPTNLSNVSLDADSFLQEDNIWTPETGEGTYTIGNFQLANVYSAHQTIVGGYALIEQKILNAHRLIYGTRLEYANMYYTGQNSTGSERYLNEKTLDEINILPSVNFVYKINSDANFRVAFGRTVARPSFKEKSIASIYDPITKRTFIGNINLQQTDINNVDARYELFMGGLDMISFSGFYKHFNGHIELVSFETAPDNLTPRNSGTAHVFGGEFEIKKAIKETGLTLGLNTTVVRSMVDLHSVIVDNSGRSEYEVRLENLRNGEELQDHRPMGGQSPYSINSSLTYSPLESGTSLSVAYNIQGEALSIIGSGRVPDVYTLPFHSLNLNFSKTFGENEKSKFSLGIRNILNQTNALLYQSFKSNSEVFTSFNEGTIFNLKFATQI